MGITKSMFDFRVESGKPLGIPGNVVFVNIGQWLRGEPNPIGLHLYQNFIDQYEEE